MLNLAASSGTWYAHVYLAFLCTVVSYQVRMLEQQELRLWSKRYLQPDSDTDPQWSQQWCVVSDSEILHRFFLCACLYVNQHKQLLFYVSPAVSVIMMFSSLPEQHKTDWRDFTPC